MSLRPPSSLTVTIRVATVPFTGLANMPCQTCDSLLDLSQPDPGQPDRFLGVCSECGSWFIVELGEDSDTADVLSLAPLTRLDDPRAAGAPGPES